MDEGMAIAELANRLNVSRQTLWRLRRAGGGPAWYKVPARSIRYDRVDAEAWIDTQKAAQR